MQHIHFATINMTGMILNKQHDLSVTSVQHGKVLTVNVIDLEEKAKLVTLGAVGEQGESVHQLPQTDVAAVVPVKQLEEPLGKERLEGVG